MKDAFNPKLVVVTGGLGYIGGVLVPNLLAAGHHVRILDSNLYDAPIPRHERLEVVIGDIRNDHLVEDTLTGADAVVHLAALVGDPICAVDPDLTRAVNQTGTERVLQSARSAGIKRFVFASTCSVYGAGSGELLTEESPLNPVSVYAESKVLAENAVLAQSTAEMDTIVLRFATIYGLAPRLRFDLVANLLTARASRGLPISIFGGEQWRPFLHVSDVAHAIQHALDPETSIRSGIYNVGFSSENYQLADLGRLIAELIPGTDLVIDPASTDKRTYRVAFDRFTGATGIEPQTTLPSGLAELRDALLADPQIDITDPRWNNVKQFQALLHQNLSRLTNPDSGFPV